jgi:hypothetical protein
MPPSNPIPIHHHPNCSRRYYVKSFSEVFLELLPHCSKFPQALKNDAPWRLFLVMGKGKCYGGCKLQLLHKKILP